MHVQNAQLVQELRSFSAVQEFSYGAMSEYLVRTERLCVLVRAV